MSDAYVVGSAAFELRATKDKLKQDLRDSEVDLKRSVGVMEREAGAGGDRISSGMARTAKGLAVGIAALTAVFAAGLAMALQFGKASLKMADDLANSAQRIGISTSALQEWQYVARKTGEDASAVSGSLETFSNKLASAAAGLSKADAKWFGALLLKPEDLRNFKDTESALDEVVDRIGALKSESDRAAIAEKLGLGPLVTALREGGDEVARLRDEARSLGFVMDAELIRKGAAAQGQLEDLSQVIGIQLAGAFIGLSDEVIAFTTWLANALNKLNEFSEAFKRFERKGQDLTEANTMRLQGFGKAASSLVKGDWSGVREGWNQANDANTLYWRIQRGEGVDEDDPALLNQRGGTTPSTRRRTPTYNANLTVPPGRQDNSAQRAAEREARRAERIEQEIYRAKQRLLQVAERDILTAQQRYDLNQDQIAMERAARDAEIESKTIRGEIKAAERTRLDLANKEADALEDRILADTAFRDIQDERIANERLLADLTANLLSLQSAGARTAAERQQIELQLLAITQKQRRDALQLQLDRKEGLSKADRDAAMAQNAKIEKEETAAVVRNNLSPLAAWRDQSLKDAKQISQALENISARGLDSLNSGLVDAIMNTRSLGDVFGSVSKQILADLLSISVRRGITEPLAAMLFGDGKTSGGAAGAVSSGGNWMQTAFSLGKRMFGFADGRVGGDGKVSGPGGPRTDSIFALLDQEPIRISTDESIINAEATRKYGSILRSMNAGTFDMRKFADGMVGLSAFPAPPSLLSGVPALVGHGGVQASKAQQVFDMRGALTTADLLAEVNQKVSAGTAAAIRSSTTIARKGAASIQQSQRRLGTT
ncbi:hypothetical protein QOZ96_002459 [Brevundimonas nasdae]|uniref:hypothetical protein n=1 Tax=Brevundimonas nasdae TaxID=172043 RepID=UPI0019112A33|nr:hypothetical protein [Brevundimonas nasdae]MBK6026047.1 hypothetical protein [Brevundimonas nasdae]MDQ0452506.1 hypothetical protein [Brevundimonas nasdae]